MNELVAGFEQSREKSKQSAFGAARDGDLAWRETQPFRLKACRQHGSQFGYAGVWRVAEGRCSCGPGQGVGQLGWWLEAWFADDP
jgi:hypothetical protein